MFFFRWSLEDLASASAVTEQDFQRLLEELDLGSFDIWNILVTMYVSQFLLLGFIVIPSLVKIISLKYPFSI